MKAFLLLFVLSFTVQAQQAPIGYLTPEDQKYYKNDQMDGNNKQERLDSVVKEINKLHGEIASLKAEMAALKAQVAAGAKK
ncbi:MAG TPA: hypothetical protein VNJ08_16515 [Bacteriovoracaceae bacterium]|nr:hypothetical protein [Bacteriovoracaceae bacterium]